MHQGNQRSSVVPRRLVALIVSMLAGASSAQIVAATQAWNVTTVVTRNAGGSGQARMAVAVRAPADQRVKHIVIFPSPYDRTSLKVVNGRTDLDLSAPWVQGAALLNEHGIAVAFADVPSDVEGVAPQSRMPAELRQDLQTAVSLLRKRYAGVPVHLGLFSASAAPALDVASRIEGLSRIAIASGGFLDSRTSNWSALKTPVLLIHAPTSTCERAPFPEAQLAARNSRFALTLAGYEKQDRALNCGHGSQHALTNLETQFADTVASWLDGAPAAVSIGFATPQTAWREQIVTYAAPGTFGNTLLEMTLLLPDGAGPFPTVIFNHGDFNIDSPHMKHKRRYREPVVAAEFLQLGFAVALPARRGVAMSEGGYPARFYSNDADPTYKARVHAQDIAPAIDYLKTRSEFDAKRIILAGHSAGGFSITHIAGTNPAGVIGAINFSGGRTDATPSSPAGAWNRMMIRGFEEIGKSSRVPTLFVFAENDALYSADTIRASYAAFIKAGGAGKLSLSAPIAGDGHFILHKPDYWRDAVKEFLDARLIAYHSHCNL